MLARAPIHAGLEGTGESARYGAPPGGDGATPACNQGVRRKKTKAQWAEPSTCRPSGTRAGGMTERAVPGRLAVTESLSSARAGSCAGLRPFIHTA